jgi:hypothetical protein
MTLNVTIHDDGKHFTLLQPIVYETEFGVITIPAGFVTDFASIPRFLWSIYPPTGRYQEAAVVHDWLYVCHYANRSPYIYSVVPNYGEHKSIFNTRRYTLSKYPFDNRAVCDALFLELMKKAGVSLRTRYTLYLCVRMFASRLWRTGTYTGEV